jgi:hypothetical protein
MPFASERTRGPTRNIAGRADTSSPSATSAAERTAGVGLGRDPASIGDHAAEAGATALSTGTPAGAATWNTTNPTAPTSIVMRANVRSPAGRLPDRPSSMTGEPSRRQADRPTAQTSAGSTGTLSWCV